jgi:serine/threonine protein kinase
MVRKENGWPEGPLDQQRDVFISYNSQDRAAALELDETLRTRGYHSWIDVRDAMPGRRWQDELEHIIESAASVLVLVGASGLGPWEAEETAAALLQAVDRKVPVIPVFLKGAPPETDLKSLPLFLRNRVGVDLRTEGFNRFVQGLGPPAATHEPVPAPEHLSQRDIHVSEHNADRPQDADHLRHVPSPPMLLNDDEKTRRLSQELEELYQRREDLTIAGKAVRGVNAKIRAVQQRQRRGPRLKAEEFLGDGRYRLVEQLGKGGFATVWKAFDRSRHELVAVKVLHGHHAEDRTQRDRFFRGAQKMASLRHPHIVQVLARKVEDDGWYFFVMELVDGPNFEQAVLQGLLTTEQKLRIVMEVGEALGLAHSRGFVHRDVKPSNILLDEKLRPKLTDFDLVRAEDSAGMTRTQAMMGTLQFAAPEALMSAKDADPATDVYSLASTTIFALRGKSLPRDYYQKPEATIKALNYSTGLKKVLTRATSPNKDRFQSIAAFEESLLLNSDLPQASSRAVSQSSVYRFVNRKTILVGVALLVLTLFMASPNLRSWRDFLGDSESAPTSVEEANMIAPNPESKTAKKATGPGGAVLNRAGIPVKLITTRETKLYREPNLRSDNVPCPAFRFWYVLPPERRASRHVEDVGSLTKNGLYRVAASDSEGAFKGWLSQEAAIEWHHNQAVQFSEKRGRQLVHFYPSEESARKAVVSGDVSEATHREPESSGDELEFMPLLKLKEIQVNEGRMNLYETAFIAVRNRVVKETTLDIVFVVDTTAGMQPAIEQVKRSIQAVDRKLSDDDQLRSHLRFGLVAYRDTVPNMLAMEYLAKVFCTLEEGRDHELFLKLLGQLRAASISSGDYPEDVLAGLDMAMSFENMKWNPLGWKQIIVIGDSSIKGPDHPDLASQQNEGNRTIAGVMAEAQAGTLPEGLAQGGFVISAVRIHHPGAKDDNLIGDQQFSLLVAGRTYNGQLMTARGGNAPEDFSGALTQAILDKMEGLNDAVFKPGVATIVASATSSSGSPPVTAGKTATDFPWPVLDTLNAVGEGSAGGLQLHRRYTTEFDADGNRVFVPHVFIRKGQLLSFNSMLDLIQGQLEDVGDPGHRDVTTILRGLQAVSATLNLSEPITADTPIDKFLNLLLKNPIFQRTIGDLAAMSQTDYGNWTEGIKAQRDTLRAFINNDHNWFKLHADVNERAAHAFIPLSDLP